MKFVASMLLMCFCASAQITNIIPASRLYNWVPGETIGVTGGIRTNRPVFTNMTSLDPTGVEDCTAKLQAALNACPGNEAVVIPAGTFRLDSAITLSLATTLKGAGMDRTIFSPCAGFKYDADSSYHTIYTEQLVTSGLTKGSTNIGVADTSSFTVGKLCLIAQFSSTNQTDNPLIVGTGGTNNQSGYLYRVIALVKAKTANSITIWPPLYGDMSARNARIKTAAFQQSHHGVEDMTILLSNAQVGIAFGGTYCAWIRGVRIKNALNYSISLYDSVNVEVRDCFLDDQDHNGSNGAGLLFNTTSGCLIENNVIKNSVPGIEMNAGSGGNVIAYNFVFNTNGYYEIDSNHGAHNSHNLFEGNVIGHFISDGYFGSDSDGTLFRNWVHGQQTGTLDVSYIVALKRFTRNYSLVGNIFGSPSPTVMSYDGMSFGGPNIGNGSWTGEAPPWADWLTSQTPGQGFQELDTGVTNTLTMASNFMFFSASVPSVQQTTNALPASLFRTSKPSYFTAAYLWPPITREMATAYISLSTPIIPAQAAYLSDGIWPVDQTGGTATATRVRAGKRIWR